MTLIERGKSVGNKLFQLKMMARKELEDKTGKSVITNQNYLKPNNASLS